MEVYEHISESLMSTGDLMLEYYPDLPLEFIVIPMIIFIGIFLKQRRRNMQKQTPVAYPRCVRQYISMLFQQKLFWHIQEKYRGKENDVKELLAPQPYEEKLCLLLGTVWKRKKRALAEKGQYSDQISQSEATDVRVLRSIQVERPQILPESESNSDEDDNDEASEYSMDSMETAIQNEQVITEINYESNVSEGGDSDFRTAEYESTHKIPIDYESAEKSCSSDYGEDFEDEDDEKVKEEQEKEDELSVSTSDAFENNTCKLEEMHTNEPVQEESPQGEEICDTQVASPHCLETAGGNEVTELKDYGGEDEEIIEENCQEGGECIVENEDSLPPPSDDKSLEEESLAELETIAEEEEDEDHLSEM